jgi:hypothetical protein
MNNLVYAFNRHTGTVKWRADARSRPSVGPTVIGPIVLLTATPTPDLRAWSAENGAIVGQLPFDEPLLRPVVVSRVRAVATMAAITGGLAENWKLSLYGQPLPSLAEVPLKTLPGVQQKQLPSVR